MATPAAVLSILVKTQGVQQAQTQLNKLDTNAKRTSGTLSKLGSAAKGAAGLVGVAGLGVALKTMGDEYREAQKTGAQTNAVLKSTRGAANVTRREIESLAGSISKKTGIDDEQIQASQNMLLTFTKLRNETGKGNDIFNQATQVVTDMSVALGQSGKSSAIQLGKALNDPIKGITALRRVGVSFTADQQKQIETMVRSGDTLAAQRIILRELTTEFGGSAAAQATAGDRLRVSLGNLAEAAGRILVPMLDRVFATMARLIDQFVAGEGIARFILAGFQALGTGVTGVVGAVSAVAEGFRRGNAAAVALVGVLGALTAAWIALKVQMLASAAVTAIVNAAETRGTAIFVAKRAAILAARAAVLLYTAAQFALNAALTANPIGLVIVGLVALGAALVAAYTKSKTFRDIVNALASALRTGLLAAIRVILGGFSSMLGAVAAVARAVGADGLAKRAAEGQRAIDDLRDSLRQVPDKKNVEVAVKIKLDGQDVDVTKAKPLSSTPPGGDGPGVIGSRIASKVRSSAAVKNAAKNAASVIPATGGAVGSLMGASSALGPFAAVGARFGLHVTSGLRPGSVTSSGNVSYHSSGRAVDLGNGQGPDAAKLAAFRALKSMYGSRLAELIYTPGGVGIKNGQPFRYTGQVAADHFDHVHVAFTGGRTASALGQAGNRGDGFGVGDGIGDVARLARGAGFKGDALTTAIAVAGAESGFRSKASNSNTNGSIDRGYWQINSIHGAKSTFNPAGNARAAFSISSGGKNWRPWVTYNTGAYRRFLGQARAAAGSVSANATGGKSGGGATGATTSPAAATAERVSPFTMGLAQSDLDIEQATRAPNQIGSRNVSRAFQQVQAMTGKRKLIGTRIRSIRKALKGELSPSKRLALTQELTQRLQEHGQLGTDIQALRSSPAGDINAMRTAQAALTPGLADDLTAAQGTVAAATSAYQKAIGTGDPAKITEAATALKSASDNLDSVSTALKDAAVKTQFDWADAGIALAGLTETLEDDRVAIEQKRQLDEAMLNQAKANNDPVAIAQYAGALKQDIDALASLEQTLKDQQAAMEEHTAALKGVQDELKRQTDTAVAINQTDAFQLKKWAADVISGQIGGYNVMSRSRTPGTGVEWSY